MMKWELKTFDALTVDELYQILQNRVDIFVVEQECAYNEIDGHDRVSYHLFAKKGEEIVAYLRILPPGTTYKELSIGRVIVKKEQRRDGLGSKLIYRALQFIQEELDETVIKIQAQQYLLKFYRSFGFKEVSQVYMHDGIPHVDMTLHM